MIIKIDSDYFSEERYPVGVYNGTTVSQDFQE
jgi:hypothetical protein